ncbi:sensor histidine kinase [Winogradskyella sp.]
MTSRTKNILHLTAFWLVMFLYLLSTYWLRENNKVFITIYIAFKVLLQFLLSVIITQLLIPFILNKKRKALFVIFTLFTIYLMQTLYSIIRINVFEVNFPEVYKMKPPYVLWHRMTSFFAFMNNIMWLVFPTILLVAVKYYQNQRDILALKEQKITTELNMLKQQLNPHFLFNTLNNLYALALKKSDKTPEVIAKLSDILDYILYQCEDKYVPIDKEILLLENYIALEKVRYGRRVDVEFKKNINHSLKIAPLILLTFVENAFKHGISQELGKGLIQLELLTSENEINFRSKNSKPTGSKHTESKKMSAIGMDNIEKQLGLLYPNKYELVVNDNTKNYELELKLKSDENI